MVALSGTLIQKNVTFSIQPSASTIHPLIYYKHIIYIHTFSQKHRECAEALRLVVREPWSIKPGKERPQLLDMLANTLFSCWQSCRGRQIFLDLGKSCLVLFRLLVLQEHRLIVLALLGSVEELDVPSSAAKAADGGVNISNFLSTCDDFTRLCIEAGKHWIMQRYRLVAISVRNHAPVKTLGLWSQLVYLHVELHDFLRELPLGLPGQERGHRWWNYTGMIVLLSLRTKVLQLAKDSGINPVHGAVSILGLPYKDRDSKKVLDPPFRTVPSIL